MARSPARPPSQKKLLRPCSEVGLRWAGARSQASYLWFPSAWEEDMLTTLTHSPSGWGEEGLGNLVLTLGKNSLGNPSCGTPDPLFLCFPRSCGLEAVRVATPRWPGSLPTSLFSLSPLGDLSKCPNALWAKLLCSHLPQALSGSGPAP